MDVHVAFLSAEYRRGVSDAARGFKYPPLLPWSPGVHGLQFSVRDDDLEPVGAESETYYLRVSTGCEGDAGAAQGSCGEHCSLGKQRGAGEGGEEGGGGGGEEEVGAGVEEGVGGGGRPWGESASQGSSERGAHTHSLTHSLTLSLSHAHTGFQRARGAPQGCVGGGDVRMGGE